MRDSHGDLDNDRPCCGHCGQGIEPSDRMVCQRCYDLLLDCDGLGCGECVACLRGRLEEQRVAMQVLQAECAAKIKHLQDLREVTR